MDILTVILAGRGGGKKPKNILKHSYRISGVTLFTERFGQM
jgi:hypothetical protein